MSWWKKWWKEKAVGFDLVYAPKADITAYELAQIVKIVIHEYDAKRLWEPMPPEVKRHCYLRERKL